VGRRRVLASSVKKPQKSKEPVPNIGEKGTRRTGGGVLWGGWGVVGKVTRWNEKCTTVELGQGIK